MSLGTRLAGEGGGLVYYLRSILVHGAHHILNRSAAPGRYNCEQMAI